MAYHFSSYRNLWDFWEKTILELHELKQSNFVLDFDGKNLREKLEEINDWHRMEIFADDILRKIWQKSTQNVTEYNWDKIFDELPPTNEEGKTFLQEYSWAKNNTIWDFHWNLEDSWNREKELQNQVYNLADIIYKLERTLKYKPNKDDFPPGYDDKKEYKNLSSQLFGHLKKNVLKGEGIAKILHNKKRQE